jgi:hypothetical protein
VTIPSPDISNDQEKVVVVPPVHKIFTNTLSHSAHRPIHVNFDVSSIAVGACPGSSRKGPATGFSADESVSLCLVAGANPNVCIIKSLIQIMNTYLLLFRYLLGGSVKHWQFQSGN